MIVLLLTRTADAQLCTGSLGDPVVNIDFGSGSTVTGPPLGSLVTNYNFITQLCPPDGSYTIVNSTSGCFNSTWHTLAADHTPGDINGYMMLINASYNPGVFYADTVRNLCGGTTYEFSAWLTSVLRSSSCMQAGGTPNITFNIETIAGTVIQTMNTGNIPNTAFPQWTQYGFYFTLPANYSELVLRLVNNAPGGCGNDLALDDITFRPCGPKVNAGFANVNAVDDSVYYCISDNENITVNGNIDAGYNNPSIQWQQSTDSGKTWLDLPGANALAYNKTYSVAGKYQYRMSVAEAGNIGIPRCRVASNILTVIIDGIPVPKAGSNSPACFNSPLTLTAKDGDFYQWTGPNGFTAAVAAPVIANASFAMAGKYYVLVTTKGGCSKTDSTAVIVSPIPVADAGSDTSICEGKNTMLQASGGVAYRWQYAGSLSDTTVANPIAAPLVTTTYIVSAINAAFCRARDSVTITVLKSPAADAGADKKIIEGETVQLSGIAGGDTVSYFWTPPQFIINSTGLTPVVQPFGDITYTLHVMATNGCGTATDEVFVRVLKKIKIPNAFSPNGDGINDVWNIEALASYPESETNVFNRYGQLVFHSQGYGKPWDGRLNSRPVPVGTYYYTIDRKNNFATSSGWVMVIR